MWGVYEYMRLEPSFLWLGDIYATLPVETIHIVTRNVPNTCNNTLPINMEWLSKYPFVNLIYCTIITNRISAVIFDLDDSLHEITMAGDSTDKIVLAYDGRGLPEVWCLHPCDWHKQGMMGYTAYRWKERTKVHWLSFSYCCTWCGGEPSAVGELLHTFNLLGIMFRESEKYY